LEEGGFGGGEGDRGEGVPPEDVEVFGGPALVDATVLVWGFGEGNGCYHDGHVPLYGERRPHRR
jgi:hypothetical protein